MASTPSLFARILQTIIHKIWAVLFFLTVFSLATLANHWWDAILGGYHALEGLILAGLDLIRQ